MGTERLAARRHAFRLGLDTGILDRAALAFVVGLGIVARIVQYADGRSLWIDEAMLALNILHRSYGQLVGELLFMQSAPLGFLVAEKLVVDIAGPSEYALRFLPLLAGIASLLVFAHLSREFVSGIGRVVAVLLVALSPPLVFYSAELKQYGFDVLAGVVIVLVTLAYREQPSNRRLVALTAAGAVAVAFSHASVFVLAGAIGALGLDAARHRSRPGLVRLTLLAGVWAVGFATSYGLSRSDIEANREALTETSVYAESLSWYVEAWREFGSFVFGEPSGAPELVVALAGLLAIAGIVDLARRDLFRLTLLALPLAGMLGASTVGLYPFGQRYMLFAIPLLALLGGCGVAAVGSWVGGPGRGLAVAAIVAAPLLAFLPAKGAKTFPIERQELRPVLEHVRDAWRPGDVIYLYAGSQHSARYLAEVHGVNVRDDRVVWPLLPTPGGPENLSPSLRSRRPDLIVGRAFYGEPAEFDEEVAALAGQGRVWVVLSHVVTWRDGWVSDLPSHVTGLDHAGTRLDEFHRTGASAYLYDFR